MAVKIFSVGQVNKYIKNIISQDYLLRDLTIKGEVSNCKYHSSGNIFFSLKDETGNLQAVMFSSDAAGLDFRMQDGQSVIVKGRIDIFERDGKYQLYAKNIKQDGVGSLAEQFEILKMKLNEEGLFDFEHKKEIPKFPKTVGIVTASTGAAIQDIKNVARRRNPYVQLILYPAKVQGEGAADTIVRGIKTLDAMKVDTIIVGRGGGSIEDLWAFNEEIVVRAIFDARTPIISGTGHEVDTTLADYAADLRAPTPSAAAELAIPDVMITVNQFHTKEKALHSNMQNRLRLTKSRLDTLETRLYGLSPERRFKEQQRRFNECFERMNRNIDRRLEQAKHRYSVIVARLDALSPTAKLVGGFGYVESGGKPLTSAKATKSGDHISITLSDGVVKATVD
jgi:exodeoxyribonuclease VII large subunit